MARGQMVHPLHGWRRWVRATLVVAGWLAGAAADAGAQQATAPPLVLATLDWPPYTGPDLPGGGLSTAVVHAAASAAGLRPQTEVLPWKRAVQTGLRVDGYVGYYPEYFSDALQDRCLFSDPIGFSPLGFVHRRDIPLEWATLDDLRGRRIGTVQGYVNSPDFDRRAARGDLTVEAAIDDASNLRKVQGRRIDLAVIDTRVMDHLLTSDPDLRGVAADLQSHPRLLDMKTLHVCFRKTPDGVAMLRAFNSGLKRIGSAPGWPVNN